MEDSDLHSGVQETTFSSHFIRLYFSDKIKLKCHSKESFGICLQKGKDPGVTPFEHPLSLRCSYNEKVVSWTPECRSLSSILDSSFKER